MAVKRRCLYFLKKIFVERERGKDMNSRGVVSSIFGENGGKSN